jgi:hypothetical protein
VVHYHVVGSHDGDLGLEGHDHSFLSVAELVTYFRRNPSRLAVRLGRPLSEARVPITPGCHYPAKFEVRRSDVVLDGQTLGCGRSVLVDTVVLCS